MNRRRGLILGLIILALLAAGIGRVVLSRQARQAQAQAEQAASAQEVAVKLHASDWLLARARDLPLQARFQGTLTAVRSAVVKARSAGELQGLTVREGDTVRAGQVLARVEPLEPDARLRQARLQAQAAQAQLDLATRNHANSQALVARGFVSPTALATTQSALDAAQANAAAAQAGVDLAGKALADTVLRAPLDAQVAQRLVQNGERVVPEARVLELIDNRALELTANLNAAEAQDLRVGQSAWLTVDGVRQPVSARVVRINPSAAVGSRAVVAYLSVAGGSALRHGLFASGHITLGQQRVLALPLEAVRTERVQPFVQVVVDDRVRQQAVKLGVQSLLDGVTWVAIEGLSEGAVVLTGRVGVLQDGARVIRTTDSTQATHAAPPPAAGASAVAAH